MSYSSMKCRKNSATHVNDHLALYAFALIGVVWLVWWMAQR